MAPASLQTPGVPGECSSPEPDPLPAPVPVPDPEPLLSTNVSINSEPECGDSCMSCAGPQDYECTSCQAPQVLSGGQCEQGCSFPLSFYNGVECQLPVFERVRLLRLTFQTDCTLTLEFSAPLIFSGRCSSLLIPSGAGGGCDRDEQGNHRQAGSGDPWGHGEPLLQPGAAALDGPLRA